MDSVNESLYNKSHDGRPENLGLVGSSFAQEAAAINRTSPAKHHHRLPQPEERLYRWTLDDQQWSKQLTKWLSKHPSQPAALGYYKRTSP